MPRFLRMLLTVPFRYHVRSLFVRKTATALTILAVGFSVATLVLVLALKRGFELSLMSGGRTDNVLFLRQAATSEGESAVSREQFRLLAARPEVAIDTDGGAMAVGEMYAGISLDKVGAGSTNVSVRGTAVRALSIRSEVRVAEGRMFREGTEEVVVGKSLVGRVAGCRLGGSIDYGGRSMPVVGILESGGAAESEIWGDAEVFLQVFKRESFTSVFARLKDESSRTAVTETVRGDPRLQLKVTSEAEYLRQQAGRQGAFFQGIAYFLASIMAIGAIFGSTNTLLASLAGRNREIGTLLSLGYRPFQVLLGFLAEALTIGLLGGLVGVAIAWPINGVATGTTNWETFTEQAFAFAITADVVLQAVVFAGVIGVVGGLLPAFRAAMLPPTEALRA